MLHLPATSLLHKRKAFSRCFVVIFSAIGLSACGDWAVEVAIEGQGSVIDVPDGSVYSPDNHPPDGTGGELINCQWDDPTSLCFAELEGLRGGPFEPLDADGLHVQLLALPASGFVFAEWQDKDPNPCVGYDHNITLTNPTRDNPNTLNADVWCKAVFVPEGTLPTAIFTVYGKLETGQLIDFNAAASHASGAATLSSYQWGYGDDVFGYGVVSTHTYTESGDYRVRLVVRDSAGIPHSSVQDIHISDPVAGTPVAHFTALPNPANVNQSITFDASGSTDDGGIISYSWDFDGNGSVDATGSSASHSYGAARTYTARLTVMDEDGLTNTAGRQITVMTASGIAISSAQITPYLGANDANLPHHSESLVRDLVVETDAPMSSVSVTVQDCTPTADYDCDPIVVNPPANYTHWAVRLPILAAGAYSLDVSVQGSDGGSDTTTVNTTVYADDTAGYAISCQHSVITDTNETYYLLSLALQPELTPLYGASFSLYREDPKDGFDEVVGSLGGWLNLPVTLPDSGSPSLTDSGPLLVVATGLLPDFVTPFQTSLYIPDLTTGVECPAL